MKNVFIVATVVLMVTDIILYVSFRRFLKMHAEEKVETHEKTLWVYIIGMMGVSVLIGLSGIMLSIMEL